MGSISQVSDTRPTVPAPRSRPGYPLDDLGVRPLCYTWAGDGDLWATPAGARLPGSEAALMDAIVQPLTGSVHQMSAFGKPVDAIVHPLTDSVHQVSAAAKPVDAIVQPLTDSVHQVSAAAKPVDAIVQPLTDSVHRVSAAGKPVDAIAHLLTDSVQRPRAAPTRWGGGPGPR